MESTAAAGNVQKHVCYIRHSGLICYKAFASSSKAFTDNTYNMPAVLLLIITMHKLHSLRDRHVMVVRQHASMVTALSNATLC